MKRNALTLATALALLSAVVFYATKVVWPSSYGWHARDQRAGLMGTKDSGGVSRDDFRSHDAEDFMSLVNKKESLTREEAARWREIVEKYDGAR